MSSAPLPGMFRLPKSSYNRRVIVPFMNLRICAGLYSTLFRIVAPPRRVAAIRNISRSCLDPNDFTVLNCTVKGHASLSPPSLRLRLCSRFTLLAT
ncbi:hypothetical protein TNCV_918001 [Trichonephila clavipes]|nr:hypothetical protein TNCV_918001 [Trichonephila clavipes]